MCSVAAHSSIFIWKIFFLIASKWLSCTQKRVARVDKTCSASANFNLPTLFLFVSLHLFILLAFVYVYLLVYYCCALELNEHITKIPTTKESERERQRMRLKKISLCIRIYVFVWIYIFVYLQRTREKVQFENCMLSTLYIQINILSRFPINTKFSIRFPTHFFAQLRWARCAGE